MTNMLGAMIRSAAAVLLASLTVCILVSALDAWRHANGDSASVTLLTTHDKMDAILTEVKSLHLQGVSDVKTDEPHDRIDDTVYMTILFSVILTIVTLIIFGLSKLYRRWLCF
jgi:hypothetical protein